MFDIGWSELLVIAVVAIVVVGPKDLPPLLRTFGRYAGKARRMAADFQYQFEQAIKESELDEVRKAMESVRDVKPPLDLKASIDQPLMLSNAAKPRSDAEPPPTSEAAPKLKSNPKATRAASKAKSSPAKRSKVKASGGSSEMAEAEASRGTRARKTRARKQP